MKKYKVKLSSGRVIGPLDLERVHKFIERGKIDGTELAREQPSGEWQNINQFPEIADLFLKKISDRPDGTLPGGQPSVYDDTVVLPENNLPGLDQVATRLDPLPIEPEPQKAKKEDPVIETPLYDQTPHINVPVPKDDNLDIGDATQAFPVSFDQAEEEATQVADPDFNLSKEHRKDTSITDSEEEEQTQVDLKKPEEETKVAEPSSEVEIDGNKINLETLGKKNPPKGQSAPKVVTAVPGFTQEPTLVIDGAALRYKDKKKKKPSKLRNILVLVLLVLVVHEFLFEDEKKPVEVKGPQTPVIKVFRPILPETKSGPADPQMGQKLYGQGMSFYVLDHVVGYKKAAALLREAIKIDSTNIRAQAMLASTYLNLIDVSNKDENYFSVIQKLIDMSRAKAVDLPETVIADVEFFITVNKGEDATQRIVKYTEDHTKYPPEMFYYLAYSFFNRGEYKSAIQYIRNIPENKAFSAKVFYLRGQIAESLQNNDQALVEYEKAIKMNPKHVKSRLAMAEIQKLRGKGNDAKVQLDYVIENSELSSAKDVARAFYLRSSIYEVGGLLKEALQNIQSTNDLVKDNRDYILQLYSIRWKLGKSDVVQKQFQEEAKMYYFMGEGEKYLKEGKYTEALNQFLESRKTKMESAVPLVRIGDMFLQLNAVENARINYKLASEKAPKDIDVWSKYINILILSYDWDEALKAMDKFRKFDDAASTLDKLAGDMYARQGRHDQAQFYYKKAMARDSIDMNVYIAYSKSLLATKKYDDASFFLALALRNDPLNLDVVTTNAKIIAASEGPDRGISYLKEELKRRGTVRAELLSQIAEFLIQKGDWDQAERYVNQAMAANAEYASPFKLQAQIYMNKEGQLKNALDKALEAYKSYSDRNPSDPSGYLERYRVFVKKTEFEKAKDELNRIYEIYPKYPNLHYYMAALYGLMGNHRAAIDEFKIELKNTPQSVSAMVALGKELIEVGSYKDALNQFTTAMQLAPQAAEPKHQAGYANYLLKNYAGAVALMQAAIAYDKGNPLLYKRLGMAYREMGDGASASQAFRKYLEMEPDAPDRAQFQRFL